MRQIRTKLLTTTALAMGLLLPTAVIAQQSTDTAPAVQDQSAAPMGAQSDTGANQSMGSQDLGQALSKLEIAQKRFEQAEGDGQSGDLEQARTDALDAINQIEQALQEKPDQADDTKVSDAREAIDAAKEALEQEDRQPQQVALAIGKLHDSVTSLQPMDQQQSALDQPSTGDQSESGSSATGEQQSSLDQSPTDGEGTDQASRDPNVEQTGEAEVTVQKSDPAATDADRAASTEDTASGASTAQTSEDTSSSDMSTAQTTEGAASSDLSTAQTSEDTASSDMSTAQTSEGTAPTPETDTAQTSEGTAPTPESSTAQTSEPQQTAPGAETPQSQVAAMGSSLVGKELYGADDSSVGEIEEVVAGPDGQVTSVLIDVGGFLGIGSKRVAIDVNNLEMRGDRLMVIGMTEDQIEELPEHTSE